MARKRRTYTPEFKAEAVKLVTEQGYSVAEAARSLGIHDTLLRSWKQALEARGDQAFPGHGIPSSSEAELRRLRAENQLGNELDRLGFELRGVSAPPSRHEGPPRVMIHA